jgi:hypothetical protein
MTATKYKFKKKMTIINGHHQLSWSCIHLKKKRPRHRRHHHHHEKNMDYRGYRKKQQLLYCGKPNRKQSILNTTHSRVIEIVISHHPGILDRGIPNNKPLLRMVYFGVYHINTVARFKNGHVSKDWVPTCLISRIPLAIWQSETRDLVANGHRMSQDQTAPEWHPDGTRMAPGFS